MSNGARQLPEIMRNYRMWVALTQLGYWDMTRMRNEVSGMAYQPQISILVPVYNTIWPWLGRMLDSVMSQTYPHWELCICEDTSNEEHVRETLELYERLDERISVKYLEHNEGISGATNHALSLASGEFVGLLDHDDELTPNALFEVVKFLQEQPEADLIYSDEDKIDESGKRMSPHLKIGWSPDLAMSCNYMNHFSVYRRSIVEEIGGWRRGFEGAQDLDLVQRFSERSEKIFHIPKVLYHWRGVEGSTAVGAESKPYTHERARRAYEDSLRRRGIAGSVKDGFAPNTLRIEREIIGEPLVSVIIPFTGEMPQRCLDSLRRRTSYPNYEIAVVDVESGLMTRHPGSGEQAIEQLEHANLSDLRNAVVRRTTGEYVLMLNPGLEATSERWLEGLLQHAQRPEVGAVGGKLTLASGETFEAGLILDGGTDAEGSDGSPRFYRRCDRSAVGFRYFWDLNRNCSAVSTDCIMFRREKFEAMGGFDETHFKSEFADVDFCLRMRERGSLIVYTPYAVFTCQDSPPQPRDLTPAQVEYVRERWGGVLDADPYYNNNLLWKPEEPPAAVRPRTPEPRKREEQAFDKAPEAPSGAGASPPPPIPATKSEEPPATSAPPVASNHRGSGNTPPPFFVVGHGRSGTTWLEMILNSHPEVLCKGEGMFFGRKIRPHEAVRTLAAALADCGDLRIWHDMRVNRWSTRTFEEDLPGMVRVLTAHVLETELAKNGKKLAGDKTPHYISCLKEVHDLYPDAKIVQIIRDGRDVSISNIHAFWQNTEDRGGPIPLESEELELRDAYLEDRKGFLARGESIFSESRIMRLSRNWKRIVSTGREDGRKLFGENYLEIYYEDLLNVPVPELTRLFKFLGVDSNPEIVDRVVEETRFEKMAGRPPGQEDPSSFHRKGVAGEWKEVFTERDRRIFKEGAGDLLLELGYERDPNW